MSMFVDTSALYALIDSGDQNHGAARAFMMEADPRSTRFVTHLYVILESIALAQKRIGMEGVRDLVRMLDVVDVQPVEQGLHDRALAALLGAGRRSISLVDWTTFTLMRDLGLRTAFTFDSDFIDQGFDVVPVPA